MLNAINKTNLAKMLAAGVICFAVPALAADIAISQANQTFSSTTLNLHSGDKINFRNDDSVTHNITVKTAEGEAEDLGLQKPGGAVFYQFHAKGSYRVVCSIHPRMKMVVIVQ